MKYKRNYGIFIRMVILLFMMSFILFSNLQAQNQKKVGELTRGRAWSSAYEALKMTIGTASLEAITYPGYYSDLKSNIGVEYHPNGMWGIRWYQGPGYVQRFLGEMSMAELNEQKYDSHMNILQPCVVVRNYNFELDPTQPEEYMYGAAEHVPIYLGYRRPRTRIKAKQMVWSLPKYDDFIIQRHVIVNGDTADLEDFYWFWHHTMVPTYGGRYKAGQAWYVNDDEYVWDTNLITFTDEDGAFAFYDDTEMDQQSHELTEYTVSPGDVTGDCGDPGNIEDINSIDWRLYSPQICVDWIVDCPVNKNGEKKVWANITARANDIHACLNAPGSPQEDFRFWSDGPEDPDLLMSYLTNDAPRMDWEEAFALDPNKIVERTPALMLAAGPYDIAPGDSIELIRLICFGEMDRDITMLGGLEATQNFREEGFKNLHENWEAALSLIAGWRATGNWNYNITEYPPPTPGNTPGFGLGNELEVELFMDPVTAESGVDIAWAPIPDDYVDPIKQYNDFVGYKVYRSEISIMGPWIEAADIKKEDAQALLRNDGKIEYRLTTATGIPYRFLVTTYDDDNLECGRTAYSLYAVAAKATPSNRFSNVRVIPNPFKQSSRLPDLQEAKRLTFTFIPALCTIKIFNIAGELIQTIEHDDGFGEESWGSTTENNYMLTRFSQNVTPGVYIYYIESHVPGHEGESATGKFAIIK